MTCLYLLVSAGFKITLTRWLVTLWSIHIRLWAAVSVVLWKQLQRLKTTWRTKVLLGVRWHRPIIGGLSQGWALCWCPVCSVHRRREVWTPGWKAYISAHALAERSASTLWELKRNATRPLSRLCGSWVRRTIGSPWGLKHQTIRPWGSHHSCVHIVWWYWCKWCFLQMWEQ